GGEVAGLERSFKGTVAVEQGRRTGCAYTLCSGNLVGRIASERDKGRTLCGIDAITCADFGRAYSHHDLTADGVKDRRPIGCKLERVDNDWRSTQFRRAFLLCARQMRETPW